jgi:ABC-2 type transport system ATP-binding protein
LAAVLVAVSAMIQVEGVSRYYGEHAAVRGLRFAIADGECVGFLGLNGAGKSTTLRLLAGVLEPSCGRVVIAGHDASAEPLAVRRLVGYLPERPPLYDDMTVRGYLRFAAALREVEAAQLAAAVEGALRRCALEAVAEAPIATLSHGYRQRVGIAQAIVHDPALLILDEPTQGLDPVQIAEMRQLIRGLRGRHTILLSTHILSEIEATCDRILVLHEGRVAAEGSEAALAARYAAGGQLELELRGDEATARAALAGVAGVDGVERLPAGAGQLRLRLQSSGDVRERVAAAVVAAGLGLLGLRRLESGLEAMFRQIGASEEGR